MGSSGCDGLANTQRTDGLANTQRTDDLANTQKGSTRMEPSSLGGHLLLKWRVSQIL